MADGHLNFDTKINTDGFNSGIKKLESLGKKGLQVTADAIVALSAGIGAITAASVKVGASFEAEMAKVSAISGAVGEDLRLLTEKAKEMGASTKFSAAESAEAMEYMAMAGWKTEDMLNGIEGIMNLAAASGENLATTSDIVTDALTAFGLSAADSGHFADILAAASSNANTNVYMMGETFKYVAPVAGALKYSAEDVAVAIGLMANSGIKASQAGTSLRQILTRLVKPTDEVKATMKEMGLTLTDSKGNIKSFDTLVRDLRTSFSELSEAEKTQMAAILGGQEAMSGLLAIVNSSETDFNKLKDAIYNCNGATAEMAAIMQDNLQGDFDNLTSAAEGLGIEIYESLVTPLRDLVKIGTDSINQLAEAFKTGGTAGLIEAGTEIVTNLILGVAQTLPEIITMVSEIVACFVDNISANIPQLLLAGGEILASLIDGIIQVLPTLGILAITLINELYKQVVSAAPELLAAGYELISNLMQGIAEKGPELLSTGQEVLQNIITGIVERIPVVLPEILKFVQGVRSKLTEAAPELLAAGYEVLSNLVSGIVENIPKFLPKILDFVQQIGEKLAAAAPAVIQMGYELLSELVSGIISAIPILIEKVPTIVSTFANIINDNFPTVLAKGVQLLGELGKGLIQAIPTLVSNIPKIIQAIIDAIMAFQWLSLGKNIIKSMADGISAMASYAKTAGTNILNSVKGAVANLPSTLTNIGQTAMSGLGNAIKAALSTVKSAASKIVTGIVTTISAVPGKMLSIGKDLVKGLWNGISNMTGWVLDKIKGFGDSVLKGIKNFFGIKSPSRVFRDQIGKMLALGLGIGFTKNLPIKAMGKSVKTAVWSLQKDAAFATSFRMNGTVGNLKNHPEIVGAANGMDYDRLEKIQMKAAERMSRRPIYLGTDRIDRPLPEGAVPVW